MDKKEAAKTKLVEDMVDAISEAELPSLKAVVCQFMRLVGGAEGLAKMLMKEYNQAKAGTMIRSMILQMILQGTKAVAAKEEARDVSMISDADLNREILTLVNNAERRDKRTESAS